MGCNRKLNFCQDGSSLLIKGRVCTKLECSVLFCATFRNLPDLFEETIKISSNMLCKYRAVEKDTLENNIQ